MMKKKISIGIGIGIVCIALVVAGIIINYATKKNITVEYTVKYTEDFDVEYDGKTIKISGGNDIDQFYNIVVNSKYDSGLCDGIITHKIIIDDEIYYLKEQCQAIEKGGKQTNLSEDDLETLLKIMERNQ